MRTAILLLAFVSVLAAQGRNPSPEFDKKLAAISAATMEADVRALVAFGTRHTLSSRIDPKHGIGAARDWLLQRLHKIAERSNGRMTVAAQEHSLPAGPRVPQGVTIDNVVATLRGSETDRVVIVSGHYDSRASVPMDALSAAPGANDDASGVAVMLQCAEALVDLEPRATVLFVAYSGEEQGLLGSGAHAKQLKEQGVRVTAMLTNDIVGGVVGSSGLRENHLVRLFSEGVPSGPLNERGRPSQIIAGSDNDAPSRQLARTIREHARGRMQDFDVRLIFRQDRYLRGGDHKSFNDQGWPAVRFTEVHENYERQHQDVRDVDGRPFGDLPEALDYAFMTRVAAVNAIAIHELALAPAPPRQVRMLTAVLTTSTELRWEASPESDIGGYAVLMRRTHEPEWDSNERRVVDAGKSSVVIEQRSKDDWLFAVEAIDKAGHRSLPVYPAPAQR
ncbi:MAG: M28 family peptidase [Planctomycetes bacterium]|nr:M28 family peptidase [Planctomycetota bacterium]